MSRVIFRAIPVLFAAWAGFSQVQLTITSLSPSSATAGSPDFTLTVNGTGFASGYVVTWNRSPLSTSFVSSTQMTAVVTASLVAQPGSASVQVRATFATGAVLSNAITYTINPAPTISSLSPNSATAGDASFTLTVNGANLLPGYLVTWNQAVLRTALVNSTQLTTTVPSSLIAKPGTASVQVTTPTGATSNALTFTVNPPSITSLKPSSTMAGGGGFSLAVLGSGFLAALATGGPSSGSVVQWNGVALATTFVSGSLLNAAVPASLIASPGSATITVVNPGGAVSNGATFTIISSLAISSLSPNTAIAGGPAFTLTINGSGFVQGATAQWNNSPLQTTFVSATQLTAAVAASLIAAPGTATVVVMNPGGVASNALGFTITVSTPTISGLSPSSAAAGGPAFTLTVNGSGFIQGGGFIQGAVVQWNGTPLSTTFVSTTQLTAAVPASLIASPGTASIVAVNSGNIASNAASFTILPPAISSLSPSSATAGGAAFTLTVNGSSFVSASTVQWNSTPLTTTFVSATQLTAAVPASLIANAGMASVTVMNSASATSNPVAFGISAAPPAITSLSPNSATAGAAAFTLTVNGSGFVSASYVQWNNVVLSTTFVSATQLTAAVPANLIASPGSASITVVNPGNVASNAASFTIGSSTPSITGLSPNSVTAGGGAFTLTVNGSGFLSGAVVQWNGSPLSTTYVSAAQLTAAVPANLIASAGSASVTVVNPGGPASGTATIQIVTVVLPGLTVAPSALTFLYRTEDTAAPAPQSISVFSTGPAASFTAAFASQSGGNWLTLSPGTGQTAGVVSASVNPAGLAPGTYNGQVTIAAQQTDPSSRAVPVTLTIVGPQPPSLDVSSRNLSLTVVQGSPPVARQLLIFNTGGGSLNFTAQARTLSGDNWISLDTTSGSATFYNPASAGVTINAGSLAPGTYSAQIAVSSQNPDQSLTVMVILAVSPLGQSVGLSQTGLEFTGTAQGAAGAPQTFGIRNTGQGAMSWTIDTRTTSGGPWLSASPASGTSMANASDASLVTVSVNPSGLAAGRYYGFVRVTAAGAGNSPRAVSVVLNVLSSGLGVGPRLSQSGVLPVGQVGGPNPPPQDIALYNLSGRALNFNSTRSTEDGKDWLMLSPASGTLPPDTPGHIMVQANLTSMAAGVRRGTIQLAFDDGSVRAIGVTSVWAASSASAGAKGAREAAGCNPKALVPQFVSLAPGFTVTGGVPSSMAVQVVDDCGTPVSSGAVIVQISNDSRTLNLTHTGSGRWEGTWVPVDADAQIRLVSVAVTLQGTSRFGGETPILSGTVRRNTGSQGARPSGVFNGASFQPGDQISLGTWVSIFGDQLANSQAGPSDPPYGTNLNGTQVLLGGAPLPLQYVSPTQVNALTPGGLTPDTQQQLLIQRGDTLSVPVDVTVADVQPGIFTMNQQGTGQGAILIAGSADVASTTRPAQHGEFISIFCTGLGAVSNPPGDGVPAPGDPLARTLQDPSVTIGGVPAPVSFSGLAPGFVGLYQVNVQVPDGVTAGAAVAVVLSIGNATSNTVTMAVQ